MTIESKIGIFKNLQFLFPLHENEKNKTSDKSSISNFPIVIYKKQEKMSNSNENLSLSEMCVLTYNEKESHINEFNLLASGIII